MKERILIMALEIYIRENRSGFGSWYNTDNYDSLMEEIKDQVIDNIEDNEDLVKAIEFDYENECLEISKEDVELGVGGKSLSASKYNLHNMSISDLIELNEKLEEAGAELITKIEAYEEFLESDFYLTVDLLGTIENKIMIVEEGQSFGSYDFVIGDYLIKTADLEIEKNLWETFVIADKFNRDMKADSDLDNASDMLEDFDYDTVKGYFDMEMVGHNYGSDLKVLRTGVSYYLIQIN